MFRDVNFYLHLWQFSASKAINMGGVRWRLLRIHLSSCPSGEQRTLNGDKNKKKTKHWSHSHVHMHVICILIYFIKCFPILAFFFVVFNRTMASFLLYRCVMGAFTLLEYWFSSVALFGWLFRLRENSFPCPLSMCPFLAWWWYSPATRHTNTYLKKISIWPHTASIARFLRFSTILNPLRINYEKPIRFKHTFSSPTHQFMFPVSSSISDLQQRACTSPKSFQTFAWPFHEDLLLMLKAVSLQCHISQCTRIYASQPILSLCFTIFHLIFRYVFTSWNERWDLIMWLARYRPRRQK